MHVQQSQHCCTHLHQQALPSLSCSRRKQGNSFCCGLQVKVNGDAVPPAVQVTTSAAAPAARNFWVRQMAARLCVGLCRITPQMLLLHTVTYLCARQPQALHAP